MNRDVCHVGVTKEKTKMKGFWESRHVFFERPWAVIFRKYLKKLQVSLGLFISDVQWRNKSKICAPVN